MHTHFLLAVVVTGSAAGSAGPVARRNTGARAEYVHLGRGPCVGPSDSFSDHFASFRITGKRKSCAVLCSAASFCTGFEWRPQSRKCRLLKSEIAGSDETKPWSKKRCFKRKNPVGNLSSSTTTTSTSISISGIQCEFEAGVDYNGFNILQQLQPKVGTVNSAEECSVECQKRAECSHFTFIWNACWLKRSAEGRTAAPSGISGTCFRHPTSSETCRVQTLLPEAVADGGYAAPTWELYQPLPADLSEVAAALVNGDTLLVVGTSHTYQGSAATYAYNLADSEWTTVAPRPFMGSHHASVAVGDDVYLFGGIGYGSQSAVQVYNVAANKWAVRPTSENIPYGQMIGSASSVKHLNEIFVCGGLELAVGLEGSVSACAAYTPPSQNGDAKHGAWRSIASMLVAVNHHAAGTDGSRMYVFGGRSNKVNLPSRGIRDVQIYDPATDSWSFGPMMPFARSGMGAAPYLPNGKFYIFGGEEAHRTFSNADRVFAQTETYDTLSGDWEEGAPMLQGAHGMYPIAHPSESKLYLVGGGVAMGMSPSATFQTLFVPATELTANNSVSETVACAVLRTDDAVSGLSCKGGGIISEVAFAAKGLAVSGRCGVYQSGGEAPEVCAADVSDAIRDGCVGRPDCTLAAADFSRHRCRGPVVVQVKCTAPSTVESDSDALKAASSSADHEAPGTIPMCTASAAPVLDEQAGISAE